MTENQENKTHFGFKKVKTEEKQGLVGQIFSSVAGRYDLMNDLMSFGIHRCWKQEFINHFNFTAKRHLDMASGTGDIANLFYEKMLKLGKNLPEIYCCDINSEMLENGKNKLIDEGKFDRKFKYEICNAEELPFEDNFFDQYSIAFGMRNVTNIDKALKEAHRVLKPGGKFLCLEFSTVNNHILSKLYDLYSFNVIPKIGNFVTNNEEAYKYLVESIKQFPNQENFAEMITNSGLTKVKHISLTKGVVAIHSAFKI